MYIVVSTKRISGLSVNYLPPMFLINSNVASIPMDKVAKILTPLFNVDIQ